MAIPLAPGDKALSYALGGVMRGGVGRAGAVDGRVYIAIDGGQYGWAPSGPAGTLIDSLTITDILDETPNRCTLRLNGVIARVGAEIILTLGSKNRLERLFAGYALTVHQTYAGIPKNVQCDLAAIDYTWLLGFTKVTASYYNQTAGAIIRDLVARYAGDNGFTATAVVDTLQPLDEITFTNEDLPTAITRTCRRAGAYWYCDYTKRVHAFVTEDGNGAPRPLVPSHRSLTNFSRTGEATQVLGRVYVEGRGSHLLASVSPGDDRIPLEAVDMFTPPTPDVFLKASFQGAEGGAQHLNYTGVVVGSAGSLVGPGTSPGGGPTLGMQLGGAVESGVHQYAYTWQTAAGETKPSAATPITVTGSIAAYTGAPGVQYDDAPVDPTTSGAWKPGDTVEWAQSYSASPTDTYNKAYETPLSALASAIAILSPYYVAGSTPGTNAQGFTLRVYNSTDPNVKWIRFWHRVNGGAWRQWLSPSMPNNPALGGTYSYVYALNRPAQSSQPTTPASSAPTVQSVQIDGIAVGPSGTTARKVYRTKAGLSQLQLATTIANNTATTYVDAAADATLGANAPTGDTSALPQPAGQVNPGAVEIIVASAGPFEAAGGWAILGNGDQVVRYTGIGAGKLIGIPPAGRGALTATVVYNTTITAAPMLTGIPASGDRAIRRVLTSGDEIYLVVQVDELARQGNLAALLHVANGAREEWIQDRRLSIAEARARGLATLKLRPLEDKGIEYTCRDLLTASGKVIHVDLPAPTLVAGDFMIQQVTITNFQPVVGAALPNAGQYPTYRVQASGEGMSFEDLLNRFRVKE